MYGSLYQEGYILDCGYHATWLGDKVQGCEREAKTLAVVMCRNLQAAYAGIKKYLQKEWDL